ncbi:Clavaminate synthase-like protein [Mollisia scopiformis]|uniref:Clavaminate synthase-like protein n=1 Tax=Mollisia scopiformis TaxID=149040 RepID=A0A194WVC2_MOLSC|nr:Clavaminate synthase-like protein [Mollisia scopiformis]KUJ11918.1 Clavaminate synthase-like protein [Mollisia scopiformis]
MPFLTGLKSLASGFGPKKKRSSAHDPQNHDYPPSQNGPNYQELVDTRPPLVPVMLPRVHPKRHFALSDQGWTTIDMNTNSSDALYTSYQELLKSSKAFFDLPMEEKETFKTALGSEDGWSRVEGEKEFITLRSLESTPEVLKEATIKYWSEAGGLLNEILVRIAESLGLPEESFTVYSEPCSRLVEKTATMLRLFRYEGFEGKQSKVVAEAHRDLGLLSLVVGDTPGLEVHDRHRNWSFPIERTYETPSQTVLVGRQLERMTNSRYRAGGHLVRSYPNPEPGKTDVPNHPDSRQYRYSIVFVLRAHYPIPINTDALTTPITGEFSNPMRDITAGDLFKKIHAAHYNINTAVEERNEQKRKLDEEKRKKTSQNGTPPS